MQEILLSICIPTYNRAEYLKVTLNSIVTQRRFKETNEIEIVISDNCSDDHTFEVVDGFIKEHFSKIRYFRNEINIHDKNMEACLSRGNGMFLKLNNDTLTHCDNSLNEIIRHIKSNFESKRILFFLNKTARGQSFVAKNLDDFIKTVSFNCTWIGAFGIWKEDFVSLDNFSRHASLRLTQTDVLFRTIGLDREIYINNDNLFESLDLSKKGGYDLITIFLDNYTYLLREAVEKGFLSKKTYLSETRKLLLNFICPWLARLQMHKSIFYFTADNKFSRIMDFYKAKPLILLMFFVKYLLGLLFILIKKIIRR